MTEDFENQGQEQVDKAYQKGAEMVGKGAGKLAKKGVNKATKATGKAVKKAGAKAVKALGKVLSKALLTLAKVLLPFLPYILVAVIVIIIVYFAWDLLFNSKGKTETYQTEDIDEYNTLEQKDDGSIGATDLSRGNKIVKAFYTYFSERSLWVTVQDSNGNSVVKTPIQYNSKEFIEKFGEDGNGNATNGAKLKDKYGRESMFFLNPNALYALDEYLNKGEFRFPEQFIQPVRHNPDTYELLPIIEDDGTKETLVAESVKYVKSSDGKTLVPSTTGETEPGVWDYGLGSIVNYKEYKEDYENRGEFTKVILWNVTKGQLSGEMDRETAEQLLESSNNNPYKDDPSYGTDHAEYDTYGDVYMLDMSKIPTDYTKHVKTDLVYLIDRVTSPAGFIQNDIYHEWEQTSERFKDSQDFTQTIKKRVSYEETVYGWDYSDTLHPQYKPIYIDKNGDDTFEPKNEDGNWNTLKKVTKWKFETETKTITAYAEGYVFAKIPRYVGEPDLSGITGSKYYTDYMRYYEAYIPEDVMTKFDFKSRTGKADEELLAILEKEQYQEGGSSVEVDLDHFKLGSGASKQSFMNAMQYFDKFKYWGETYGVDPYLLVAMASQESGGKHDTYTSSSRCSVAGCGIMQIEKPGITVKSLSAYNQKTKTTDTVSVTYESAIDVDKNIQFGTMQFASRAKDKSYNLLVALQGYNYGSGGINRTILKYLEDQGISSLSSWPSTDAINKYIESRDAGWISARQWYSDSSNSNGCMFFGSGACPGDPEYLEHVLQYYASPTDSEGKGEPWAKDENGTIYTMSGANMEIGSSTGNGVSISSASSSQDGWLKQGWKKLKSKFSQLFPEKSVELPKERILFSNKQNSDDADVILKMMFVMEEKKYLTDYDRFTSEDWKSQFHLLFSNPIGGKWNGNLGQKIDVDNWFSNGYTQPLSIKPLTIQNPYNPPSHKGVDIVAMPNSNVLSVADGKVKTVSDNNNNDIGKYVVILHENGVRTTYGNLAEITVKEGNTVKKGEAIAKTGDGKEGRVLHFELSKDNTNSDPSWIVTGIFNAEDYNMTEQDANVINQVISLAKQQIGKPYVWGNRGPNSFDCSGFTQWLYLQVTGVNIGATTYEQDKFLKSFQFGSVSDLQPGDLVMTSNLDHVVLYIGNNKIIHASNPAPYPRGGVKESNLYTGLVLYYRPIGYINQQKGTN